MITFSCYRREPYLTTASSKNTFLDSLELTRNRYNFEVLGYVVMPEHVHLLLSEPLDHEAPISKALHSLKLSADSEVLKKSVLLKGTASAVPQKAAAKRLPLCRRPERSPKDEATDLLPLPLLLRLPLLVLASIIRNQINYLHPITLKNTRKLPCQAPKSASNTSN